MKLRILLKCMTMTKAKNFDIGSKGTSESVHGLDALEYAVGKSGKEVDGRGMTAFRPRHGVLKEKYSLEEVAGGGCCFD